MKGFVRIGSSTYQLHEISPEEMDAMIAGGCRFWDMTRWFDSHGRVWPPLHEGWEAFYHATTAPSNKGIPW